MSDNKGHALPQAVAAQGTGHVRQAVPHQLAGHGDGPLQVHHAPRPVQPTLQGTIYISGAIYYKV